MVGNSPSRKPHTVGYCPTHYCPTIDICDPEWYPDDRLLLYGGSTQLIHVPAPCASSLRCTAAASSRLNPQLKRCTVSPTEKHAMGSQPEQTQQKGQMSSTQ